MCKKAVCISSYKLKLIPYNHYKSLLKQEIETCDGITCYNLCMMNFVPDLLRTQERCNKAVSMDPHSLNFLPERFKTEEMCKKAVRREPYTLRYVPDHLKSQTHFPYEYKTKGICNQVASFIILKHKVCA